MRHKLDRPGLRREHPGHREIIRNRAAPPVSTSTDFETSARRSPSSRPNRNSCSPRAPKADAIAAFQTDRNVKRTHRSAHKPAITRRGANCLIAAAAQPANAAKTFVAARPYLVKQTPRSAHRRLHRYASGCGPSGRFHSRRRQRRSLITGPCLLLERFPRASSTTANAGSSAESLTKMISKLRIVLREQTRDVVPQPSSTPRTARTPSRERRVLRQLFRSFLCSNERNGRRREARADQARLRLRRRNRRGEKQD